MSDRAETIIVIGVCVGVALLWNISKLLESISRVLRDRLPPEPDDDSDID